MGGDALKTVKVRAEDNAWFLLATLYGQPTRDDSELKSKNRQAWNRYMAGAVPPAFREKLASERKCTAEELSPSSVSEIQQAFSERHKQGGSAASTAVPNFNNGEINLLDFSNVEFNEPLYLAGFLFPAVIIFKRAIFSAKADFNAAIFVGPAYFDRAAFSADANFGGATFSDSARFGDATFSASAYFWGATFAKGADFSDAYFDRANFPKTADFSDVTVFTSFSGATFFGDANFERVTFSRNAYFDDATFSDTANFACATFSGHAIFRARTFPGDACFSDVTFSDYTNFERATFGSAAYFSRSSFSGMALFGNTTFSGDAHFTFATFSGDAEFYGATFGGVTDFEHMVVESIIGFVNVSMKAPTSFVGAKFKGEPPRFFGAQLHEGTTWRHVDWPIPTNMLEAGEYVDAYERLKLEMDRLKKHEDELNFFALELRSRRVLGPTPGLSILIYGLLCNYGRSYFLPLGWLLVTIVVGAALFLTHFGLSKYPQAIGLSLANTFAVLGFRKDFIDANTVEALSRLLKVVSAVQTVAGIVLLFCFGLAVRNRFRMR